MTQQKNVWGNKDEKLRFAAYKLVSTLPLQLAEVCDANMLNDIMNIIDAALEEEELNILVSTLRIDYRDKIDVIKDDVMKQIKMEMTILQDVPKV